MLRAATKFPTFATVAQMNPAQKFNRISLCSSFSTLARLCVCLCVCAPCRKRIKKPGQKAGPQLSLSVHSNVTNCLPNRALDMKQFRQFNLPAATAVFVADLAVLLWFGGLLFCRLANWAVAAMKHLPNAFGHHLKAALWPAGKCLNAAARYTERNRHVN